MNILKRLISLVLALTLCISLLSTTGLAAGNDFVIENGVLSSYIGTGGDVVIPDGVAEIGRRAFYSCTSLTRISIPASVTSIGEEAFSFCRNLTSVSIPSGVTTIGKDAFRSCHSLASVSIPSSVTSIGSGAFEACYGMTSVSIPSSVTSIESSTFRSCRSLTSVSIPPSITTIGTFAFEGCKSLTSVSIPSSVTSIEFDAFNNCSSLTSVSIPSSVTSIESCAFYNCGSLTSVIFLGSEMSISHNAFTGTPWLESQGDFAIGGSTLFAYRGSGGSVIIPSSVTTIGSGAFSGCTNLTSVSLGNNVTKINEDAFKGCTALASVALGNNLETIGSSSFRDCISLKNITIPASVTDISSRGFSGCTNLASITFLGKNIDVSTDAFEGTPWLENQGDFVIGGTTLLIYQGSGGNVVIPSGLTCINNSVFYNCVSLNSITIPDGVTEIGSSAFYGCTNLSRVSLPDGLTTIGYQAFGNCINLTSVIIPDSVTLLHARVFYGCTNLESVTFPKSLQILGIDAFTNTSVEIPPFVRLAVYEYSRTRWINPGEYVKSQSEQITTLSNQITSGLTSDYEKAQAIAKWVSTNIDYDYDYYLGRKKTVVTDPDAVLDCKLTICDGYTRLTQALLQATGIPALYVIGVSNGLGGWEAHAWNEALVDGRWILMDNTWESTGGKTYFDMDLAEFTTRHLVTSRGYTAEEDIPSSWAQSEIWEAICTRLVPMDLQADYRNDITREEFCRLMITLVEKASGQNIDTYLASKALATKSSFTDTDSTDVLAANALGIINGISANTFNPNGSITRQEAAAMLARTARVLGLTASGGESFNDAGQFASWASESIAFVSGLTDPITGGKVMGSTGTGNFSPSAPYSREQAMLTALRLFHCAVQ